MKVKERGVWAHPHSERHPPGPEEGAQQPRHAEVGGGCVGSRAARRREDPPAQLMSSGRRAVGEGEGADCCGREQGHVLRDDSVSSRAALASSHGRGGRAGDGPGRPACEEASHRGYEIQHHRRRQQRVATGLVIALIASALAPVGAWHAFMDQETIPELPGTTLRSDIVLPILSDSVGASRITACTIAEASLRKALLVCAGTLGCGLPCAASWNSATRDAKRVVGSPCPNLEALMIKNYGSTPVSGGGDFLIDEWQTLATRCEKRCPSIPGQVPPPHPLRHAAMTG